MTIDLVGGEKLERDLAGMAERLVNMEPSLRGEIHRLETMETMRFDELGGRFVNTGATRSSLTSSASSDAVREVTPQGLAFGSAVFYARFLVEHPGPVTEKGGLKRPPPSAILKLEPETAAQITQDVGDHVMGGLRQ
jgi:hypothetical protein